MTENALDSVKRAEMALETLREVRNVLGDAQAALDASINALVDAAVPSAQYRHSTPLPPSSPPAGETEP